MQKFVVALAVAGALVTGPALAHQCPALMAQIDEALPTAELSEADMAMVMELRQNGEELHNAGDHDASEAALFEAMEMLGLI